MPLIPQTLGVLLQQFGGTLKPLSQPTALSSGAMQEPNSSSVMVGFQTLSSGQSHHIGFLTQTSYKSQLLTTKVVVVMMAERHYDAMRDFVGKQQAPYAWVLPDGVDAYLTYARVQQWWVSQSQLHSASGVHPSAVVDPTAMVSKSAIIGPQVVVGANAQIGDGVHLHPGVVIGQNVSIGFGSVLYPNVVVYDDCVIGSHCVLHAGAVIGADGFGFAQDPESLVNDQELKPYWIKIPQLGRVVLADHVEVGANTTIDRGALDDTLVGFGVKLDNQIQIAHNVHIGNHTAMAGCVGVAGSTHIGARCTIGGAAMILGHLNITDGTHISAASTVMNSIAKAGSYTGIFPLDEHKSWERNAVMVRRLKELRHQVRKLEQHVHLNPAKS